VWEVVGLLGFDYVCRSRDAHRAPALHSGPATAWHRCVFNVQFCIETGHILWGDVASPGLGLQSGTCAWQGLACVADSAR
jgi:hypothetical protein